MCSVEPDTDNEETIKTIALDRIEPLDETKRVRSDGVDVDHAEHMVTNVSKLPYIEVVTLSGGRFGILRGYHRYEAHRLAGRKSMKVIVKDLPPEDWHHYAVIDNVAHGLPLTTEDRKRAVTELLNDPKKRRWSDRRIARDVGLSAPTVGALRRKLAETSGEEEPERILEDGRTYPARREESVHTPRPAEPDEPVRVSTHPWAPGGEAYESVRKARKALEGMPVVNGAPTFTVGLRENHKNKAIEQIVHLKEACAAWLAGAGWEE